MRAFLAIELDNETRQFLCGIQNRLKEEEVGGNFSAPENLHITIKFLGDIDVDQFKKMSSLLKNTANLYHSFVLTLDSIGKFEKGNKMILWAGLKRSEQLLNLHNDLETQLDTMMPGLAEKFYSPHITLVREAVSHKTFSEVQKSLGRVYHMFSASGISLMESTRADGRLTYIRRAYEPFKTE